LNSNRIKGKLFCMAGEDIKRRTRDLSSRVMKMADRLPQTDSAIGIKRQIIRSASSKSTKDFINKLKIVEEELDETCYWLESIEERKFFPPGKLFRLKQETKELIAITVTSIRTTKRKLGLL
jgi:four helix bundle protein